MTAIHHKDWAKKITKQGTAFNYMKEIAKLPKRLLQLVQGRATNPNDINSISAAVHSVHLDYMDIMQIVNKSKKSEKFGKLKPSAFWDYMSKNVPTTYHYYNEWHRRTTGRKMTVTEFTEKHSTSPEAILNSIKKLAESMAEHWAKNSIHKDDGFLEDLLDVTPDDDKSHVLKFKELINGHNRRIQQESPKSN